MKNKEPKSRYKVVDLVHSRDSKYLKIKVYFLLTKSTFRSVYNRRKREDNSPNIYTLFQIFREDFLIHLLDGEFLKLMSKEEYRFTWNPCVYVLK